MSDTVYQVQVRYSDHATWIAEDRRNVWITPTWGAKAVKRSLSSGRAALTRYRNEGHGRVGRRSDSVEFRLVAMSGTWEEVA